MQGIFILICSLIISYFLSEYTSLQPLINFNDKFEYVPILTSNIFADLLIVYITFSRLLGRSRSWDLLSDWYKKYRLSAMLADILIGVIYLLVARYIVHKLKFKPTLFQFILIAIVVQLIGDFVFYLIFSGIPKGTNDMIDFFKKWAEFAKLDALWGDSILIVVGVIVSSILNKLSFDFNIGTLIFGLYLVPYIIYKKD